MFRLKIQADENTDIEATVSSLRAKCKAAGLGEPSIDLIATQIRATLTQLVERGQELSRIGSQINVTREVSGDGYSVRLIFGAGGRRTFIEKLLALFKRSA